MSRGGILALYSVGSLWLAVGASIVSIDDLDEKRGFVERVV